MTSRHLPSLAGLAIAAFLLAGCAATTPAANPGAGTDTDASSDAPADTASGTCPTVPQEGYELFTTDLVTEAPVPGTVIEAGVPISWTLSLGAGYTPSLDVSYVNDAGDAIPVGSFVLSDDDDNGTYEYDLGMFDSDADGHFGFATITLINDGSFTPPPGDETHQSSTLGVYCVSIAVS